MSELNINGVEYIPLQVVLERLDVSRQTLWRWRKKQHIPSGRKHPRSGQVLFTVKEFAEIRHYANRLEPLDPSVDPTQIDLFTKLAGTEE